MLVLTPRHNTVQYTTSLSIGDFSINLFSALCYLLICYIVILFYFQSIFLLICSIFFYLLLIITAADNICCVSFVYLVTINLFLFFAHIFSVLFFLFCSVLYIPCFVRGSSPSLKATANIPLPTPLWLPTIMVTIRPFH